MRTLDRARLIATCALWLQFGVCPVAGAATTVDTGPDGTCGDSSRVARQNAIGRTLFSRALAQGSPWRDEHLGEYVNRLGQNLVRASGSRQNFTFYVIYNPAINAQAFPGGYVLVNSGVVGSAESEGELASVLAHEIAHLNACDGQTTSKRTATELLVLAPLVALTGPVGLAATFGAGMAIPVSRARSKRSAERRADRLAAEYLARAGYDPRAAVTMLERLQTPGAEGGDTRGLLATHPRARDRVKDEIEILASLPPIEIVPHDEKEFLRMQKEVRDYDEIYARALHLRLPGREPDLPPLSQSHRFR